METATQIAAACLDYYTVNADESEVVAALHRAHASTDCTDDQLDALQNLRDALVEEDDSQSGVEATQEVEAVVVEQWKAAPEDVTVRVTTDGDGVYNVDSDGFVTLEGVPSDGSKVDIIVDGIWAGTGSWNGSSVECTACFGDQTDEVYEAIDSALLDAE